eukprot:10367401-Ditylum_brightwellii.AAC.1
MAFVGSDPDNYINAWSYNQDTKTYQADKNQSNPFWKKKKGPVWEGKFRPSSIKQHQKDKTDALKTIIKKIKLSNYLGENVWKMNVNIKARCEHLRNISYLKKIFLHVISKKYKSYKCEIFCLWIISIIFEKTNAYLMMSTLQDETNIPAEAQDKQQSVDPDLPKAYRDAIKK